MRCGILWIMMVILPFDASALLNHHSLHPIKNELISQTRTAGHGTVHMPGSIIDAACAISTQTQNQTILLPLASKVSLMSLTYGQDKYFSIELLHCSVKKSDGKTMWKDINVTFMGEQSDNSMALFKLNGDVSGVGLQVRDENNDVYIPNKSYTVNELARKSGIQSFILTFKIRLASYSTDIESGMGSSTIRLRLDYD